MLLINMGKKHLASILIAGGIGLAGLVYGPRIIENLKNKNLHQSEIVLESKTKTYSTGNLEGRIFGDLYSEYTGIEGRVPAEVTINFEDELDEMWNKKLKDFPNKVAQQFYEEKVKEYDVLKSEKMSLEEYISEAQENINEVNKNLDWNKLKKIKDLSKKEESLLKKAISTINGKDLISYALTEIMPSSEGELNKNVLEFLLKNAGREYVEMIPAMHDVMTSFGPYQFTSYAVYDAMDTKEGASIVNSALPEKNKIPRSVSQLEGNDHHKTAYLFAINNYANLINKLNHAQKKVFEQTAMSKKSDLVGYIATAHHLPKYAIESYKRYLGNSAKTPYEASCGKTLKLYAKKTKANMKALYN